MVIGSNARQNPAYCPVCFFDKMKASIIEKANINKKIHPRLRNVLKVLAVLLILAGIVTAITIPVKKHMDSSITVKSIVKLWDVYDYNSIYANGKAFLQKDPYNNTVLTIYGYACFFLAESQNDTTLTQEYLNECITSLRMALYDANSSLLPQIQYMLGKAYFHKNKSSSYYYSDLAIKYLNLAKQNGCKEKDIAQYLGISYANLGMAEQSIAAFSEALAIRDSPSLLLSIAEQYYNIENYEIAEQYLFRLIKTNEDDDILLKSKLLLAKIYTDKGEYDTALNEYNEILKTYENSADAYYGIGCIYEKQQNIVKARTEWRKALKIQVNHPGAQKKLSIY